MKFFCLAALACLFVASDNFCKAQMNASIVPNTVICDESGSSVCISRYLDGARYRTLTTDKYVVTITMRSNAKYVRASVSILNKSDTAVDVFPERFSFTETCPKSKTLAYVPYEKIVKSDARRAGWANAINAFGAGIATQQVSTQTSSNGTVNVNGSNGSSANGTYNGTSTSTTSVPDYAAQARANESIRMRREQIAAEGQSMAQSTLKANTVLPNQTVSGFVYFAADKKAEHVSLTIPVGDVLCQFSMTIPKH